MLHRQIWHLLVSESLVAAQNPCLRPVLLQLMISVLIATYCGCSWVGLSIAWALVTGLKSTLLPLRGS